MSACISWTGLSTAIIKVAMNGTEMEILQNREILKYATLLGPNHKIDLLLKHCILCTCDLILCTFFIPRATILNSYCL